MPHPGRGDDRLQKDPSIRNDHHPAGLPGKSLLGKGGQLWVLSGQGRYPWIRPVHFRTLEGQGVLSDSGVGLSRRSNRGREPSRQRDLLGGTYRPRYSADSPSSRTRRSGLASSQILASRTQPGEGGQFRKGGQESLGHLDRRGRGSGIFSGTARRLGRRLGCFLGGPLRGARLGFGNRRGGGGTALFSGFVSGAGAAGLVARPLARPPPAS